MLNNNKYILMVIIILIILLIVCNIQISDNYNGYNKWYQCYDKKQIHRVFHSALIKSGIERTYDENWNIYLPCNSKYNIQAVKNVPITKSNQIINIVPYNGVLGSKKYLWEMLNNYYGRNIASTVMPKSYVLPKDIHLLNIDFDNNNIYVLKTEEQRQKGITLTNKYNDIIKCNSNEGECKIVQSYIKNSILYKNHKINFRVYLLVICDIKNIKAYIYSDGIVSYAKTPTYNNNKINFDSNIASFYTSKSLYDKNYPILISKLLDEMNINKQKLFNKFMDKTRKVVIAAKDKLCNFEYKYKNTSFQLFGVDFIVTEKLMPYILEINIGPGMIPYNKTDSVMREEMHYSILGVLGINKKNDNKFTKIF